MRKIDDNQSGMVSLITVTLLGLILTIITTGFIRIIAKNQQQTVEAQLSTQAFYAAETGVEDGRRAVNLRLQDIQAGTSTVQLDPGQPDGDPSNCAPAQSTNGDLPASAKQLDTGTEYTCQLIDLHPTSLEYDLNAFEQRVVTLEPQAGTSYNRVQITWTKQTNDTKTYSTVTNSAAEIQKLKSVTSWGTTMAMMRLQFSSIHVPAGAGLTRDQFYRNERSYFVSPVASGSGSIPVTLCDFTATGQTPCGQDTQFNDGVKAADCTGSDPSCTVTLQLYSPVSGGVNSATVGGSSSMSLDDTYTSRLRLVSLYQPTHVSIKLLNSGGTAVHTANAQAMIDVTGRAQDVFRRLRVRVPISNDNFPYPGYTLQSAEDICKLFDVTPSNPSNPAAGGVVNDGCPSGSGSSFTSTSGGGGGSGGGGSGGGGSGGGGSGIGNAGIGGICGTGGGSCAGTNFRYGDANDSRRWGVTIENISNVSASLVRSCTWTFRDLSSGNVVDVRHDNCSPGDRFYQPFDQINSCKKYRADLVMNFNGLPDATDQFYYTVPDNNLLPNPPGGYEFSGPCTNPSSP